MCRGLYEQLCCASPLEPASSWTENKLKPNGPLKHAFKIIWIKLEMKFQQRTINESENIRVVAWQVSDHVESTDISKISVAFSPKWGWIHIASVFRQDVCRAWQRKIHLWLLLPAPLFKERLKKQPVVMSHRALLPLLQSAVSCSWLHHYFSIQFSSNKTTTIQFFLSYFQK